MCNGLDELGKQIKKISSTAEGYHCCIQGATTAAHGDRDRMICLTDKSVTNLIASGIAFKKDPSCSVCPTGVTP